MNTKINLSKVASYKENISFETDKRVNLIYGLNGTGKSTLSNYLYEKDNPTFSSCSVEGLDNHEILVYNQKFIQDNFYEEESLKGVFTLSKKNKDAEKKIKDAKIKKAVSEGNKEKKQLEIDEIVLEGNKNKQKAENEIWKIKLDYSGGDRVLEFCLENLKGKKEKLLNHIKSIEIENDNKDSIDIIKEEVKILTGEKAQIYDFVKAINFSMDITKLHPLLQKEIVGNENSTVAELISKLGNSDWVKDGLNYIDKEIGEDAKPCPFCQQNTITKNIVDDIKEYFNESYKNDINSLKNLITNYKEAKEQIPAKSEYEQNPILKIKKNTFDSKYDNFIHLIDTNLSRVEEKLKSPSQSVELLSINDALKELSDLITEINYDVKKHNDKINNKQTELKLLKGRFWVLMRSEYSKTITDFETSKTELKIKYEKSKDEFALLEKDVISQDRIIGEEQKKTINIEKAVENINKILIDLGIDSFNIDKHSDNFYKIVRDNNKDKIFHSLSEGEKMIISFLYFMEVTKGKKSASDTNDKKVIVIDDPISSLSHIYIFNIGQLIKKEYLNPKKYDQIFILTHSLYFFYELTDTNKDRRKENQNLFRITKNSEGSKITPMKYEEIQNDYQSYWQIVKDENQPPALIANSMRNIIEYFFNFVEKKDLNNVFQKPKLQENKYQAFNRYINRESHSLGQNIFDIKEFDYEIFKESLGLVFIESGYGDHYKAMMKK